MGWCCLAVAGPLEFTEIGILASLAKPLADSQVSIFVLSTYDTDYLLIKETQLDKTIEALQAAGHTVGR